MHTASDVLVVLLVAAPSIVWPLAAPSRARLMGIETILVVLAGGVLAAHFVPAVGGWSTTAVLGHVVLVGVLGLVAALARTPRRPMTSRMVVGRGVGAAYLVTSAVSTCVAIVVGLLVTQGGPSLSQIRLPDGLHIASVGDEDCGSSSCSVRITLVSDDGERRAREVAAALDNTCQPFGPWHLGSHCFQASPGRTDLLVSASAAL